MSGLSCRIALRHSRESGNPGSAAPPDSRFRGNDRLGCPSEHRSSEAQAKWKAPATVHLPLPAAGRPRLEGAGFLPPIPSFQSLARRKISSPDFFGAVYRQRREKGQAISEGEQCILKNRKCQEEFCFSIFIDSPCAKPAAPGRQPLIVCSQAKLREANSQSGTTTQRSPRNAGA